MCARRRQLSGLVEVCWPCRCAAGDDVPQPELRRDVAVALPLQAAGDQRVGADLPPVGEARLAVEVGDLLDIGRLIDRREQAAAPQIGGDDLRDVAAHAGSGTPGSAMKSGSAIGIGRIVALGDVELESARRPGAATSPASAPAAAPRPARAGGGGSASAMRATCRSLIVVLVCSRIDVSPRIMSRGSKVISMSFHAS